MKPSNSIFCASWPLSLAIAIAIVNPQVAGATPKSTVEHLADGEQSVGLDLGLLDYSTLTPQLSYQRGQKLWGKTLTLGTDLASPLFTPGLGDFRLRVVTIEASLVERGSFDLRLRFAPTLTASDTKIHRMTAVGEELRMTAGFYGKAWGVSLGVNAEIKNATYVKHTKYFKETVFADVHDGWLNNPANNIRVTLTGVRRFGNIDASLGLGFARSFSSAYQLFPPISATVRLLYRL